MAPISRIIACAALAAIVSARPFVLPRQQAPEMVTETDWVTVDVPVTLWVDENGTPLSTVAQGGNFAAVPTTPSSVAPVVTSASASVSSSFSTVTSTTSVAPMSPKAPVQAPSPSTSSPAPAVPTSTYVPTTPAPVTSAAPTTTYAPVPTTSQGPLGREATTASSSAPAASSPAAAAGGSTGSVSASATNNCEGSGAACVGDITHYDGGLGACGWNVNTASDMQIALPVDFMGTQSNGNPYCGRSLTIKNPTTGQTIQATVGDKCMGCSGRAIDLTDAAFNAVGNGCDGRCSGFQWWFN